jgi:hypothetical protein
MDVYMVLKYLVPGMKNDGDAEITAEPFGVTSKGL